MQLSEVITTCITYTASLLLFTYFFPVSRTRAQIEMEVEEQGSKVQAAHFHDARIFLGFVDVTVGTTAQGEER